MPRIREIASEFGGHIDVDQVAGPNFPIARYAVRDFMVDADTRVAGKVVDGFRRRHGPVLLQKMSSDSSSSLVVIPTRAWRFISWIVSATILPISLRLSHDYEPELPRNCRDRRLKECLQYLFKFD